MSHQKLLNIDGQPIRLLIEELTDGVSVVALDNQDVPATPRYVMHGGEALPPDAADLDSLLDFIEGELRRRRLLSLSPSESQDED